MKHSKKNFGRTLFSSKEKININSFINHHVVMIAKALNLAFGKQLAKKFSVYIQSIKPQDFKIRKQEIENCLKLKYIKKFFILKSHQTI